MSAAPVLVATKPIRILLLSGPGAEGQALEFRQDVIRIGRDGSNDLVLHLDEKISRMHAEIFWQNGECWIRNVSGKNFLAVNGSETQQAQLDRSAQIQMGETVLRVEVISSLPGAMGPTHLQAFGAGSPSVPVLNPTSSGSLVQRSNAGGPVGPPNGVPRHLGLPSNPGRNPGVGLPPPPPAGGKDPLQFIIYALVGVGLVILLLQMQESSSKRAALDLRTSAVISSEIEQSEDVVEQLAVSAEVQNSIQYQSAQQHYVKGFRDYLQGQYDRAIQSFQAALSFFPNHSMAKHYLSVSRRKLDELVSFHMAQGARYRGKTNWRLCSSSYRQAMILIKDDRNPKYTEAKQFRSECEAQMRGRF